MMPSQLRCANDHLTTYVYWFNKLEELDKEEYVCAICESDFVELIPLDKIIDPDVILNYVEGELENANHHSMTSLPSILYENIQKLVEDKTALAHAIRKSMENI